MHRVVQFRRAARQERVTRLGRAANFAHACAKTPQRVPVHLPHDILRIIFQLVPVSQRRSSLQQNLKTNDDELTFALISSLPRKHVNKVLQELCYNNCVTSAAKLVNITGVPRRDILGFAGTILHRACKNGHTDVIQFLFDMGAGLKHIRGPLNASLGQACEMGHVDAINLLLLKGLTKEDVLQSKGIVAACKWGHINVLDCLRKFGLSITEMGTQETLHAASRYGGYGVICYFIKWGITSEELRKNDNALLYDLVHWEKISGHNPEFTDTIRLLFGVGGLTAEDARAHDHLLYNCAKVYDPSMVEFVTEKAEYTWTELDRIDAGLCASPYESMCEGDTPWWSTI